MHYSNAFMQEFSLRLPVIMAPMFLVSNREMMEAALSGRILGVFPSLNYRKSEELSELLDQLNTYRERQHLPNPYGVNLIVQKSNTWFEKHLDCCVAKKVPFYITSLGNPSEVIRRAHSYGARVYCDITRMDHAEKCAALGCDGFIAVGAGAGGHAGPVPLNVLVPALVKRFPALPVIAAGGIATGEGIVSMLALGAVGVSMGTRFIASTEAGVSEDYKNAIVTSGMEDIVMTERLSGTPCAIINTPYARKIGSHQNALEKWINRNAKVRKYYKMLLHYRGMKKLEAAIQPGSYRTLWSAGQSSELINRVDPCGLIIDTLGEEMEQTFFRLR